MTSELRSTAYHEAGHATVGASLGCVIGTVTTLTEDNRDGYAIVYAGADVRADIMVSMAGPAAEHLLARQRGDVVPDGIDRLDQQRIARLAAEHGLTALELEDLRRLARRLIRRNWPTVQKVARALLRERVLAGRDINRLLADAMRCGDD